MRNTKVAVAGVRSTTVFFISGFQVRRIIFTFKYTTNNDLKEAFFYLQD